MEYGKRTVEDFLIALSGKDPAPGGGGACALAGAIGASLGNMVGSLTVGKAKYAAVEPQLRACMDKAMALRDRLMRAMDADAEAFLPLAEAYRMPTETEEQRANKAAAMEPALKEAATVPLSVAEDCCEALALMEEFAALGSPLVVSDAGVGAALCRAALTGAAMNVWINTKLMTDRTYAESVNARLAELLRTYTNKADAIIDAVSNKLQR